MIGFLAHFISKDGSDEDPFDLLVNLYSDHYKLWRYRTSKILQTDDVDDIIHDVFMRILSSHLDFLKTLSKPKQIGYISKALEHEAFKKLAARRKVVTVEDPEYYHEGSAEYDPLLIFERHDTYAAFERAFNQLPRKQQDLIYFKFFEDLPDEEIAKRLGLQPASLRSLLARARRTLKEEMRKEEDSHE